MTISASVSLLPITTVPEPVRSTLLAGISALELMPGQEEFSGEPRPLMAKALTDPQRHLFAITAPGVVPKVVGMGVLHVGAATDAGWFDDDSAILLRGFVVDRREQGLGYGRAAAMAAFELAHGMATELALPALGLVLGVNDGNVAGLHAYARAGFGDRGQYLGGRSGPQRVMYRPFRTTG